MVATEKDLELNSKLSSNSLEWGCISVVVVMGVKSTLDVEFAVSVVSSNFFPLVAPVAEGVFVNMEVFSVNGDLEL